MGEIGICLAEVNILKQMFEVNHTDSQTENCPNIRLHNHTEM